jgi:hypothetical protein
VIGHALVSVAHPSPGPPPPTPRAGLPITGLASGVSFTAAAKPGGAGAVAPPPAAGAAR